MSIVHTTGMKKYPITQGMVTQQSGEHCEELQKKKKKKR